MKKGVLLLNFGCPSNYSDVAPFLKRLFNLPEILTGVPGPARPLIAQIIAALRATASEKKYRAIGGTDFQRKFTEIQIAQLKELLPDKIFSLGMLAGTPSIEDGLKNLMTQGAEEVTVLPLFPHFSSTTSGACFRKVDRFMSRYTHVLEIKKIRSWHKNSSYLNLLGSYLENELLALNEPDQSKIQVIIVAHSLPIKLVRRGDPYIDQVHETYKQLRTKLKCDTVLAFQSGGGPSAWVGPFIEQELEQAVSNGKKSIIVMPISFTTENIETLWDLDLQLSQKAKELGLQKFRRVPAFNNDKNFTKVLISILNESG